MSSNQQKPATLNAFMSMSSYALLRSNILTINCAVDFMMGGTAAAISKTAAAPIERVKLLIQNQGAMIASGRLAQPYGGIVDCFKRTYAEEGVLACKRMAAEVYTRTLIDLALSLARQRDERYTVLPDAGSQLLVQGHL